LPLIISVFLMYIDSLDDIFMIVELFLCDIHCPIARSKNQLLADDSTLRDLALLKIKSDKIRSWVSHSPHSISNWRSWLSQLPLPLIVTFLDCLLVEGPKVKFRFALGFLLMLKSTGYIDEISNQTKIDSEEAKKIVENVKFDKNKMLSKAFGIKRLSWSTCKTLISRHLVLLDLSSERGIGTAYSTVSRLSQANAGEFFEQGATPIHHSCA